jgi:TonB family protein
MILKGLSPLHLSLSIHFLIVVSIFALSQMKWQQTEKIDVPIVIEDRPLEAQKIVEVKEKPKVVLKSINEPKEEGKSQREVFGASRRSYTDENVGDEGVAAKKGNTLAKETDKTILEDSDADSLPTPTEEYLVSEMPRVLSEVKPTYPKEAKEKSLEGAVVMDILIDDKGKVRLVSVIEGEPLFRSGAVEAMKKFLFKPAMLEGKPVAVKIRYTLRFQLEY